MGFFDLNIPYHESDRRVIDKSSLKSRRLKLVFKAMELGYTGVAYNRTLKGVLSEYDRCAIPVFPLSSLLKLAPSSSYFAAAVKFHRELLNVASSTPFRQYTRLTLILDSAAPVFKSSNGILKSYDILAVRPLNQNAFDQTCKTSEVDIIAIDFSEKLPFRLKQPMVQAAIKRGVYFEITYSGFLMDAQARREIISNCKLLVDWTRGNNLIISSAAPSVTELRGPYDVANLLSLLGLSKERAKAAISKNCRSILGNALRKKQFFKEAIKVEHIPSSVHINSEQSLFDEWLKWDPISSGDGDLLLDDIEKSFLYSSDVVKPVKSIDFTSSMNGLPAHGLQIKDLISVTKVAPEPPDVGKHLTVAKETKGDIAVNQMPTDQGSLNPFPEKQDSPLPKQARCNPLSEESQTSSEGIRNISQDFRCDDSVILLDPLPRERDHLTPLPEEGETLLNNQKDSYRVYGHEDSDMLDLPTDAVSVENSGAISIEKLRNSCMMDGGSILRDVELHDSPQVCLRSCTTNVLSDGSLVFKSASKCEITPFDENPAFIEHSASTSDTCFPAMHVEESNLGNRVVVESAENDIFVDNIQKKMVECANSEGPFFVSPDIDKQNRHMEREQTKEMTDCLVTIADGLAIQEYINLETNMKSAAKHKPILDDSVSEKKKTDPITSSQHLNKSQAGRQTAKRRATCKPFMSSFKLLLNPKPFKRKARKSKSLITM